MRTRIRVLIATLGIVAATVVIAAPAFAQETSNTSKPANEAAEKCIKTLEGGGTIDDCQSAPSPLKPENNEVIWGSLAFLVLLVAMWKWGVPAVRNMERTREERIRNDLESAEQQHLAAEALRADYERQIADSRTEAGRIIEEGRLAAETVRKDLIARAEADAEEIRQRAQADIANQQSQAMAQLRSEVAALSIDLASRIVERNLDNDTNRQLVNSFIDQVGTN